MDNSERSIAIMQPYIFPYLGYFQLINAVDEFIFYDDVNFIKRGWINRNKILINSQEHLISFPCIKASQNKLIKEIKIDLLNKQYEKNLDSIKLAYKKSPYFKYVYPLVEKVFSENHNTIADLCIDSVKSITGYLNLNTEFKISSENFQETKNYKKNERLKKITCFENCSIYINTVGGKELYDKSDFKASGIDLYFLNPNLQPYQQFNHEFVPRLSIIDVLMFNSKEECKELLKNYHLE